MLQSRPLVAPRRAEPLRVGGVGRRAVAIGLALAIEALLLLLLLSLGAERGEREEEQRTIVVNVAGERVPEVAAEPGRPERSERPDDRPAQARPADAEAPAAARPADAPVREPAAQTPQPAAETPPVERTPLLDLNWKMSRSAAAGRPAQGPQAPAGGSSSSLDSERVGTAPNGEPLYAATWYQRPRPGQLRGYLATASGPGWGLIACRTAPNYRVEDCVALDEYPAGSQINRALLAAAWEFKVRPPRLGGRSLVRSWVRIRVDYEITRR